MKKNHYFYIIIIFLAIICLSGFLKNISKAQVNDLSNFSITGEITDGIYNIYGTETLNISAPNIYNFTHYVNKKHTVNNVNMDLLAIRVSLAHIYSDPYSIIVADNTSNSIFAVPETVFDTSRAKMAQYFELDNFTLIQKVNIYLNYTMGGLLPTGNFQIDIYNASDFSSGPLNVNDYYLARFSENYVGWRGININEYYEAGQYYAVFSSWVTPELLASMNNNSWLIKNYSDPADEKGPSLFENSSGWFSIPDDSTADFLMTMNVSRFPAPNDINLTVKVNNELLELNYRYTPHRVYSLLTPLWIGDSMFYLPELPTNDYNISITTNITTINTLLSIIGRYIYREPTNGSFTTNLTSTTWVVDYKKVNSSQSLAVSFQFPSDWVVSNFYDEFGHEIVEYGIIYSYIYSEHGTALFYEDYGDGTQTFNYKTVFNSPNYIKNVGLYKKTSSSDEFKTSPDVYIGDIFKIQAQIKDSDNQIITNGNYSFFLFDTNGGRIYSKNASNINGNISSDDIDTTNWASGQYTMILYWNNGKEFGLSIYTLSISISPWLITIFIAILIAVIVAAVSIFSLTYVRRKLSERNWVKSLQYLLILNKKGGTPMYSYSFGKAMLKDSALISGMISAITEFVRDTTGSKKQLRTIDQEDKKVILSHGKYSTVAILSNKNLPIIHKKAEEFLHQIEELNAKKIINWTGDMTVFKGFNKIVEDFFPISMEDKLINKIGEELNILKERIQSTSDPEQITQILKETTKLTELYSSLILKNFNSHLLEIIKIANKKMTEPYNL